MKQYDVSKVQSHSSAVLDLHLRLAEKNALLQKLVFDQSVVDKLGGKKSHHGVATLQHTLYLSCAQDIAKIVFDRGRRTPSLSNILRTLKDGKTKKQLEHNFSIWDEPDYRNYTDPAIVEALKRIDLQESEKRLEQFNALLKEFKTLSKELLLCPTFKAFKVVRDKITAHTEIKLVADKYVPIDLGSLSLKWGDINRCVNRLERPVELMAYSFETLVLRGMTFTSNLERTLHPSGTMQRAQANNSFEPILLRGSNQSKHWQDRKTMGDWDFLHDMHAQGYTAEEIADAAGCGVAPWQWKYIDLDWVDSQFKELPEDDAYFIEQLEPFQSRDGFPYSFLKQAEIFQDLVECAARHFENTGRYLQIWGELGEIYAEIKFGLRRHGTHTAGSDGTINGKLVEVKTISPEKSNDRVMVKSQGDFEKLLIIRIDQDFHFQGKLFDRNELKGVSGKFLKGRLKQ